MQTQTKQKYYTPEEYLAREETTEFRSEYHDGEIIEMTGGSINHNRIIGNVFAYLKYHLRGQNKEIFTSDLRVWIARYKRFVYPDVFVIDETPILEGNRTDTVTNPSLIVEVLSKSTQHYDHTDKFRYYRSIPSFKEYILINQYEYSVEHYTKTNKSEWLLREYEATDDIIDISSLNIQITLNDIYEGVDFEIEMGFE
jgi:Uma2 family endonuclease